ncbi:uncharacterized protein Dmoj_GI11045 [Drosophila mojavensis]|uniref:Uncharacterized protein n=1 Tax=Drosophila mojavensis TaxID=7230 RepID=B4L7U9_DROMO|nr:uncharacterized protein Dmoj_GI11045 [Drosophila mojavensis]
MSLRPLVEGDCGGVNPLMQLGGQFTRDVAHKDEGFAPAQFERSLRPDEQLVNDFLGQVAGPPQSFQMDALLQEMRGVNIHGPPQQHSEMANQWGRDFMQQQQQQHQPNKTVQTLQPLQSQDFFDETMICTQNFMPNQMMRQPYLAITAGSQQHQPQQQQHDSFFDENVETIITDNLPRVETYAESLEDWISDYQRNKELNEQQTTNFNEKFWQRLQDEWQKLAEENEHPWLSEFNENLDAYKEYEFAEQNPMTELDNAFEKGKEYLNKGDIPSAVLCFEVAVKKEPQRAEIWQLLGISQAENEMDPQAIAALKKALEIQPDNRPVLMALAVCYTNEGLQSNAVKMLSNWLEVHPQYKHLLSAYPQLQSETVTMASSLIGGNKLRDLQQVYLEAVRMQPAQVDSDLQEALGVLYNLSGEFDKAVDCYRAAVHVDPQNAKLAQAIGQNQMSESIWSTLKMVISLMGRSDLQGHISDRNLSALNEAFKD